MPQLEPTRTRRADLLRVAVRPARGLAQEIVMAAGIALTTPLALAFASTPGPAGPRVEPSFPPAGERAAPPVILVHGLGATQACWSPLRRALRADGRTVVTFDYAPWGASVEELADRLVETVEHVMAVTGAQKVHLVGHSLGGVIIAQALVGERLAGCVDLVATLGSPFHGSPWARLAPMAPLVRALRAGSPLLRGLAAATPPAGVRWLAFTSNLDPIVPAGRAVPAHVPVTRVDVETVGHGGMLLDPDVIRRIVAATAVPALPAGPALPAAPAPAVGHGDAPAA